MSGEYARRYLGILRSMDPSPRVQASIDELEAELEAGDAVSDRQDTPHTVAMTLPEFLLARIAEDRADQRHSLRGWVDGKRVPGRWARECDAKRLLVGLHGTYHECTTGRLHGIAEDPDDDSDALCPTIRVLAAVYADHPDYRQEWRP